MYDPILDSTYFGMMGLFVLLLASFWVDFSGGPKWREREINLLIVFCSFSGITRLT